MAPTDLVTVVTTRTIHSKAPKFSFGTSQRFGGLGDSGTRSGQVTPRSASSGRLCLSRSGGLHSASRAFSEGGSIRRDRSSTGRGNTPGPGQYSPSPCLQRFAEVYAACEDAGQD
eukprot:TRINITY_DN20692_c0_g2_i1.p2 TRINITY_DN20692_c0_g2~~TRINITY_DN20692_c0_g2_i1.p2  ORF type:complete len:115 (-),score=4.76 TRINITY_DN20692_c0_g2_i1:236-580(-)